MAAQQIKFFRKNKIDLSFTDPVLTVTDGTATDDGASYLDQMRDRKNNTGWFTFGSNDAANTQIDVDMVDAKNIDHIILIKHNFAAYTIQYWNGAAYTDFSTAINVSGNTAETTEHTFDSVNTTKIRLIITGTIVANADKKCRQFIVTEKIGAGQFEGWPIVKPTLSLNRRVNFTPSGKAYVVESAQSYQVDLSVLSWKSDTDLTIVEEMFFNNSAFLVWPCGGDESQFSTVRRGYRLEDIFLMKCVNEWKPEYYKGNYFMGIKANIKLVEVI